jgi:hypothetical protein
MPVITCDLTDHQLSVLAEAASRAGMSIEEFAAHAAEAAVAARYKLPEVRNNVVPLQALNRQLRGPPKSTG